MSEQAGGYVYLIRLRGGLCKIGTSSKPAERIRSLTDGLTVPVEFICSYYVGEETCGALALERAWHRQFESKRVRGEWFQLTDRDIDGFVWCARYESPDYAHIGYADIRRERTEVDEDLGEAIHGGAGRSQDGDDYTLPTWGLVDVVGLSRAAGS